MSLSEATAGAARAPDLLITTRRKADVHLRRLLRSSREGVRALTRRRIIVRSDQIPYELTGISTRRALNALLTELSTHLKLTRPLGLPTHVMIEPSTFCNLRCKLCPVVEELERPQGNMNTGLFRRFVDQVGDTALIGLLWDWGEPFVNPAAFDMIAYAKSKGMALVSSTNGHVFADSGLAEKLIESGLDTITFAVDGITQETYQHYRADGDLATVLEGIRNVVRRKRETRSPTPVVNLRFIVMAHNEHEVPRLREVARQLGVDALTLKTLNPGAQDPYSPDEKLRHRDMVPRNLKYRRFQAGMSQRRRRNPCTEPWNGTVLHWNGTVVSCTYDTRDHHVLGNLNDSTFREIWHGQPYRDLRRRFRRDWTQVEMCAHCSYAFEGGSCTDETIAEAHYFDQRLRRLAGG